MIQLLTNYVLPLLLYSGPMFTFGFSVYKYPDEKLKKFYINICLVHAAAFLPFFYGVLVGKQDAIMALMLPALTGALFFISGIIFSIYLSITHEKGI